MRHLGRLTGLLLLSTAIMVNSWTLARPVARGLVGRGVRGLRMDAGAAGAAASPSAAAPKEVSQYQYLNNMLWYIYPLMA
jgi:hypothetical protein